MVLGVAGRGWSARPQKRSSTSTTTFLEIFSTMWTNTAAILHTMHRELRDELAGPTATASAFDMSAALGASSVIPTGSARRSLRRVNPSVLGKPISRHTTPNS